MSEQVAVFADERTLLSHNSTQTTDGALLHRGWEFRSFHSKILNEADRISLAESIRSRYNFGADDIESDSIIASGRNIHIPPMIFKSFIRASSNNFCLEINAKDAITAWASQHSETEIDHLKVTKVSFSKSWTDGKEGRTEQSGIAENEWDWTFSTDYTCTQKLPLPETIYQVKQLSNNHTSSIPRWNSYPGPSKIDTQMLSRKDDILFFDDVLLYQDDLEDCGEVMYSAKIRVMPTCWFLLCRLFLRVDGVKIIIHDVRFFHIFGALDNQVHMDVCWRECSSTENVWSRLSIAEMRDSNYLSQVLPVVNEKYNIQQHYSCSL